jgi:nucleoside-diphosphate-sugar epimerase
MQHGVPARIVRPFHTYGPGLRLDDGRVFADFVADVLARRPIALRSSGTATRSFCYLADTVAGFFSVLLRGQNAVAYNVGDDRGEVSIRDLADLLVATFPERGLSVRNEARPADDSYLPSSVERSCPDISRVRSLGWQPSTSLADGFRRTVASFA